MLSLFGRSYVRLDHNQFKWKYKKEYQDKLYQWIELEFQSKMENQESYKNTLFYLYVIREDDIKPDRLKRMQNFLSSDISEEAGYMKLNFILKAEMGKQKQKVLKLIYSFQRQNFEILQFEDFIQERFLSDKLESKKIAKLCIMICEQFESKYLCTSKGKEPDLVMDNFELLQHGFAVLSSNRLVKIVLTLPFRLEQRAKSNRDLLTCEEEKNLSLEQRFVFAVQRLQKYLEGKDHFPDKPQTASRDPNDSKKRCVQQPNNCDNPEDLVTDLSKLKKKLFAEGGRPDLKLVSSTQSQQSIQSTNLPKEKTHQQSMASDRSLMQNLHSREVESSQQSGEKSQHTQQTAETSKLEILDKGSLENQSLSVENMSQFSKSNNLLSKNYQQLLNLRQSQKNKHHIRYCPNHEKKYLLLYDKMQNSFLCESCKKNYYIDIQKAPYGLKELEGKCLNSFRSSVVVQQKGIQEILRNDEIFQEFMQRDEYLKLLDRKRSEMSESIEQYGEQTTRAIEQTLERQIKTLERQAQLLKDEYESAQMFLQKYQFPTNQKQLLQQLFDQSLSDNCSEKDLDYFRDLTIERTQDLVLENFDNPVRKFFTEQSHELYQATQFHLPDE